MSERTKRALLLTGKLAVAVGAFAYLFLSGRLALEDLALLGGTRWPWALLGIGFYAVSLGLTFLRFGFLIRAEGVGLPYGRLVRICCIGTFFNNLLPSNIGGDAVKVGYAVRRDGVDAYHAVSSVLMDRVLGLLGLLVVGCGALLWQHEMMLLDPQRRGSSLIVFALLLGLCLGAACAYASLDRGRRAAWRLWLVVLALLGGGGLALVAAEILPRDEAVGKEFLLACGICGLVALPAVFLGALREGAPLAKRAREHWPLGGVLMSLVEALSAFRHRGGVLTAAVLISFGAHLLNVGCLYALGRSLPVETAPRLGQVLFAAPMGFLGNALPISFGGAGVGEVGFQWGLEATADGLAPAESVAGGAVIFLLYRLVKVLLGLPGLALYVTGNAAPRAARPAEAADEEEGEAAS